MSRPSEELRKYLGFRETKENGKGNAGFDHPDFQAEMVEEHWQKFWPWCCSFMRVIYVNAYDAFKVQLRRLFTPSVLITLENCRKAGLDIIDSHTTGRYPAVDWAVFWQEFKGGKPQGTGHIGCITAFRNDWTFDSGEGNTDSAGSREGVMVAIKSHRTNWDVQDGLRVVAFVNFPSYIKSLEPK